MLHASSGVALRFGPWIDDNRLMAKTWRVRLLGTAPGDSANLAGQVGIVIVRGPNSSDVRFGRVMVTLPNSSIVTVRDEPPTPKPKPKPKPKPRKNLATNPKSKTARKKAAVAKSAKKKRPKRVSVWTVSGGGFETNRRRH
jgi:hypothetical protein